MTLWLWADRAPFAELDALRRAYAAPAIPPRSGFVPAAEVSRDGDDAVVRVELPGLDVEKDVTVEVDEDRLVVRGERRDERAEQHARHSVRELRYGSFRRSFTLPAHVTSEAVSASYDAGVLSVRVAGAYAGAAARRIPVTAGAAAAPAVEGEEPAEHRAA
ncbi:Hsp20/alpha crystallin family protein [Pseudonocardia asaccharolytica]|uniref:Heat shock protein Hsp20 n=1 Tax=Pseudonocardia asaccharolytica DSM 44247 = NBRC 16224 TaxID=1123024 RepID=A0A511DBP3_9PSEU|nr:Hsp20/alpha crystallin family protein [Pseudonocardia asaccharolytica]GEL20358.1 heat shock protein Hsp20 [Pseudonocardia asaccharolytica DSM 44247 = NBRC 16224]